jgi:Flp pilus assembly pilin Flp
MRETARDFIRDEAGMGTVEIILIIVVLIGLVIIFKKQINDLVTKIFKKITSESNQIIGNSGDIGTVLLSQVRCLRQGSFDML